MIFLKLNKNFSLIIFKKKHASSSNSLKKEKIFAFTLLIMDSIFFIFNVPLSCTEINTVVVQNILLYPSNSPTSALATLLHAFANTLAYIYYILPFFVNLCFNKMFRKQLNDSLHHPMPPSFSNRISQSEFSRRSRITWSICLLHIQILLNNRYYT